MPAQRFLIEGQYYTIPEIANQIHMSQAGVTKRIKKGYRGAQLLLPHQKARHEPITRDTRTDQNLRTGGPSIRQIERQIIMARMKLETLKTKRLHAVRRNDQFSIDVFDKQAKEVIERITTYNRMIRLKEQMLTEDAIVEKELHGSPRLKKFAPRTTAATEATSGMLMDAHMAYDIALQRARHAPTKLNRREAEQAKREADYLQSRFEQAAAKAKSEGLTKPIKSVLYVPVDPSDFE